MSVNIWGVDPKGNKTLYFLRCPSEDLNEELEKAKKEGWTELATTIPDETWTPIQTIHTLTTQADTDTEVTTEPKKKRGRPRGRPRKGPTTAFAEN